MNYKGMEIVEHDGEFEVYDHPFEMPCYVGETLADAQQVIDLFRDADRRIQ